MKLPLPIGMCMAPIGRARSGVPVGFHAFKHLMIALIARTANYEQRG
jgi:hypothetical protein